MNQQFVNGGIYFVPNPLFPISYVLTYQPIVRGMYFMQMGNGLTQNPVQENVETHKENIDNIDIISIHSSSEVRLRQT